MAPTKVLITGVTGYVGGTILAHLVSSSNPTTKDLEISVLTRNDDRARYFSSANLKVYTMENLDDTTAITAAASEHDIVIHTASGYHRDSARALIQGLSLRKQQNPDARVYYMHTSGTSDLADRAITKTYVEVARPSFSDKDPDVYAYLRKREQLEQYGQRTTDLVVVETGRAEGVPTTIIMSPTIYGLGSGPFNRLTIQYPLQMRGAVKSGRAEYVGEGQGVWDFVHVADLAALYEVVLLDWAGQQGRVPVGEKGIIFSGTGRASWKEVAERIGRAGVELGVLEDAETRSVGLEEAAENWVGGDVQLCELGFFSNVRTNAEVGRELGWRPTRTREDWERSFREEFEEALKKK